MNEEQFSRELRYQVSLCYVEKMLNEGIISIDDYKKWRAALAKECDPPIGRIVSNSTT